MAFSFFPGGEKREIAEESLDAAIKEEKVLKDALVRSIQDKERLAACPPPYFNEFQLRLALAQAEEDSRYFSTLLLHAQKKVAWERDKKWRTK